MKNSAVDPGRSGADAVDMAGESDRDQVSRNIGAVLDFYAREGQKISRSQRIVERVGSYIGQPAFLGLILLFVAAWMLANSLSPLSGVAEFDPAPYFWLQGIVGLAALLTTTVILAKQNRFARLEEQRAHLA